MALNVAMDLEPFSRIDPCGYAGLQTVDLRTWAWPPTSTPRRRGWPRHSGGDDAEDWSERLARRPRRRLALYRTAGLRGSGEDNPAEDLAGRHRALLEIATASPLGVPLLVTSIEDGDRMHGEVHALLRSPSNAWPHG